MKTTMQPIHRGEVLLNDFLAPPGVTQHRLAISIGVPLRPLMYLSPGSRSLAGGQVARK